MMKRNALRLLFAAAVLMAASGVASAAGGKARVDAGKYEYTNSCAVCHGAGGKGDSPGVEFLRTMPGDLSTLSKRNGGVFPFERVYAVIDGRETVKGHGSREMPIWGDRYSTETVKAGEYYVDMPYDMEMYVRSRIISLIDYLHRLQAK
jgi:mono/diheme cytochrome c family protein